MNARATPDWKLVRQVDAVKVWEAVALSIGIDPNSVKRFDQRAVEEVRAARGDRIGEMSKYWLAHNPGPQWRFNIESSDFKERLEIAARNCERLPTVGNHPVDDPMTRPVRLAEFAAMARELGWEMPSELTVLAPARSGKQRREDNFMRRIRDARNRLLAERKEPSARAIGDLTGIDPRTVGKRLPSIKD